MGEAKSGYECDIQVYTGARLNEDREVNLSGRVVRELMVHTRTSPVHRQLLHQSADDAGVVSTQGN